jgi:hypothetical protein
MEAPLVPLVVPTGMLVGQAVLIWVVLLRRYLVLRRNA